MTKNGQSEGSEAPDKSSTSASEHYHDYDYGDEGGYGYGHGGYSYDDSGPSTHYDPYSSYYGYKGYEETTTTTTTTPEPSTEPETEEPSTTSPPTTPAPEPKKDPYERVGSYIDGLAIFLIPWMVILCIGLLLPWIESLARRRSLAGGYELQLDNLSELVTNSVEKFECLRWAKCRTENAILQATWGRPVLA